MKMLKKSQTKLITLFVLNCFLFLPAVQAQEPDAGSLLRQHELEMRPTLPRTLPDIEDEEETGPIDDDSVKVVVKEIRFTGATDLVPEAELQAIVAGAIGQKLGFESLQALTDKVTRHLRQSGWILARAYLPRQDVTEGNIEITILEGRLDGSSEAGGGWQINLSEGTRIEQDRLLSIAEQTAGSGGSLKLKELERALLLMNDLPGVTAKSVLEPGTQPGSTIITVDIDEGPLFSGTVIGSNSGNHSTGDWQLMTIIDVNDPFGIGAHGGLTVTGSDGIKMLRLGYDAPLGYSGLRGAVNYTGMRYNVTEGVGEIAGLEGDSYTLNGALSYPFIRSRLTNLHGRLAYDYRALKDESDAGELRNKRVNVLRLGLTGELLDRLGGGGMNRFGLTFSAGDLDLSRNAADHAADASSLKTDGKFSKTEWDISRLQRLSNNFTLLGRFSGQWANENLDSSEEFILGGPSGVRAYPVAEAQGDEGWLANIELRYDWPQQFELGQLQLSLFADSGHIRLHESPGSVPIATVSGKNSYQLSGAGLELNLGRANSHNIKLSWAHTLGNNSGRGTDGKDVDGKTDNNRFWLQGIFWF